MAIIKIEAQRALAGLIACEIPQLKDKICGIASAGERLEMPSLSIETTRSLYSPDQEDQHFAPSENCVVLNVGRHIVDIELRLGTSTVFQRAELEQHILDLFLVDEGHPGILLTQLTSCKDLGPFVAAWELEDETWENEKVFDRTIYSVLKVTGVYPALVTRRGVYTIRQLQLATEIGPAVEPTDAPPALTDPEVEIFVINEDGTFAPLP